MSDYIQQQMEQIKSLNRLEIGGICLPAWYTATFPAMMIQIRKSDVDYLNRQQDEETALLNQPCIYFMVDLLGLKENIYVGKAGKRGQKLDPDDPDYKTVLARIKDHIVNGKPGQKGNHADKINYGKWDTVFVLLPKDYNSWDNSCISYLEYLFTKSVYTENSEYARNRLSNTSDEIPKSYTKEDWIQWVTAGFKYADRAKIGKFFQRDLKALFGEDIKQSVEKVLQSQFIEQAVDKIEVADKNPDDDYRLAYNEMCKKTFDKDEVILDNEIVVIDIFRKIISDIKKELGLVDDHDEVLDDIILSDNNKYALAQKVKDLTFLDISCKFEFLTIIRDQLLEIERPYYSRKYSMYTGDKLDKIILEHILNKQLYGAALDNSFALMQRLDLYRKNYTNNVRVVCGQKIEYYNLVKNLSIDDSAVLNAVQDELKQEFIAEGIETPVDIETVKTNDRYLRLNKEALIKTRKELIKQSKKHPEIKEQVKELDEYIRTVDERRREIVLKHIFKKEFNVVRDFDIVIGNPPYQIDNSKKGKQTKPLFDKFIETGIILASKNVVMITNNTFLSNDSKKDLRTTMIEAGLEELDNYPVSGEVFPGVGVSVCVFNINKNNTDHKFKYRRFENWKCTNKYEKALNKDDRIVDDLIEQQIEKKIDATNNLGSIVLGDKAFGIASSGRMGFTGKEAFVNYHRDYRDGDIKLWNKFKSNSDGDVPEIVYVNEKDLPEKARKAEYLHKYKVVCPLIVSKSSVTSFDKAMILDEDTICTQNLSTVYVSSNKEEANNFVKYMKTGLFKFSAYMFLSEAKTSISSVLMSHVPLQDFTSNSDIDWSAGLDSVNKQLYVKYNLTNDEIKFIENALCKK